MAADTPPTDLVEKLARLAGVCCRTCAEEALAALASWADGHLIDPATWTRWDRKEQPATPLCPVHGDAACPEEYMLKSNGEPWAHYAEAWSETARCGRRPTVPLSTLTPRED